MSSTGGSLPQPGSLSSEFRNIAAFPCYRAMVSVMPDVAACRTSLHSQEPWTVLRNRPRRPGLLLALVVGIGASVAFATVAAAQSVHYSFTKVVGSEQRPEVAQTACVALNENGTVVFVTGDGS